MLVLALDTATPATTVALLRRAPGETGDDEVLAEDEHVDARRHAEVLMPMVDAVLRGAGAGRGDLAEVVVGTGPGAYTGLRVGVATAAALGLALDVPVRPAVTLDALAVGSGLRRPFAVVTDARRREVFWARYDERGHRVSGPEVALPAEVAGEVAGLPVVGAGGTPWAEVFADVVGPQLPRARWLPTAADRVAGPDTAGGLRPLYLRRPDVTVAAKAASP